MSAYLNISINYHKEFSHYLIHKYCPIKAKFIYSQSSEKAIGQILEATRMKMLWESAENTDRRLNNIFDQLEYQIAKVVMTLNGDLLPPKDINFYTYEHQPHYYKHYGFPFLKECFDETEEYLNKVVCQDINTIKKDLCYLLPDLIVERLLHNFWWEEDKHN